MDSLMGKGRKPKFDVHLKIYDLNNVPLVSGNSFIKWHLTHSMHAEHRGRTPKHPIANHRVDYSFSKHIQHVRISVDRHGNLAECPIEFEIIQEFAVTEKTTLGVVRINLSEYVEESEALIRDHSTRGRRRANSSGVSPTTGVPHLQSGSEKQDVPEGIVRRYLMQDSKINSTLKMSILVVQVDGDRNFVAPPLKTATTFGGIAGIVANEPTQVEDDTGPTPNISKYPRDTTEVQDLYRRTLVASWCRMPVELPADECIEDIFSGGNGWGTQPEESSTDTDNDDEEEEAGMGTLRPSDIRRMGHHNPASRPHHHGPRRSNSGASDKSTATVTTTARASAIAARNARLGLGRHDGKGPETGLSHRPSLTSLNTAGTTGSDHARRDGALRISKEVKETEARDDLVAWRLPS